MTVNEGLKDQVLEKVDEAIALCSDGKIGDEGRALKLLQDVKRMIKTGRFERDVDSDAHPFQETITYIVPKGEA